MPRATLITSRQHYCYTYFTDEETKVPTFIQFMHHSYHLFTRVLSLCQALCYLRLWSQQVLEPEFVPGSHGLYALATHDSKGIGHYRDKILSKEYNLMPATYENYILAPKIYSY